MRSLKGHSSVARERREALKGSAPRLAACNLRRVETSAGRKADFFFLSYVSVGCETTPEADHRIYYIYSSKYDIMA